MKTTNKQRASNEQTGLGAEPGTHEGRHKNDQRFAIHRGRGRARARTGLCLGSTGSFRFLSLLSGKEAEEVGCASSTVDLHLHLVVFSGCLSAYKYARVRACMWKHTFVSIHTFSSSSTYKMKTCNHTGQKIVQWPPSVNKKQQHPKPRSHFLDLCIEWQCDGAVNAPTAHGDQRTPSSSLFFFHLTGAGFLVSAIAYHTLG